MKPLTLRVLLFVLCVPPLFAAETAFRAPAAKTEKGKAGIVWVSLPAGKFLMGTGIRDERPPHEVRVKAFQLAKTEATVEQYRACVDAGACTPPDTGKLCVWGKAGSDKLAVNCVSWDQAQAFARWAGGRLPTEAEWEYAARSAGKGWEYPWGNEDASCDKAVMASGGEGCGKDSPWAPCSKAAGNTVHGLCDMAGNVWEWVQDHYHASYQNAPADGSAWETPRVPMRVLRGGSWRHTASGVRTTGRNFAGPDARYFRVGLRIARDRR